MRRLFAASTRSVAGSSCIATTSLGFGCGAAAPLRRAEAARTIRTFVPPRAAVTVIMYLDHYGNPIRNKEETDISLVRTRDNKFFLQRVFDDESVVRWACPGLACIKHASNYEYFSLGDVDIHGGVLIPADVTASTVHDRPLLSDVVFLLTRCRPTQKFLRKDRRAWHRRLFAHWEESPEKYRFNAINSFGFWLVIGTYLATRYLYYTDAQYSFFDTAKPNFRDESFWGKIRRFSDRHPEHLSTDISTIQLSPAQQVFTKARSELRTNEVSDPAIGLEWVWKIKHCYHFGHWPKSMAD